jgi:trimethylamine:corrinoid methyltransferase-like protein
LIEERARALNDKALNYLEKYDCTIDRKQMTAKIPEAVVNELMKKAPPNPPLYNRDLKSIPKKEVYFRTFGEGAYITERDGSVHPSTLKDVEKVLIIGNALPTVDSPTKAVAPRDLSPETANLHAAFKTWNIISNPN